MTTAPELFPADAPAFDFAGALVDEVPRLRRLAARRLGDTTEAEEIAQEALLRACRNRPPVQDADELGAWLTVVTSRLTIDRLRVRDRTVSVADVPEGRRVSRDTAEIVVARSEARAALDALESMPSRQAAVLWAREVEGLSYEEIAERFGMSEPSVRSVLHRGRRTLRRLYAAKGGTLAIGGAAVAGLAPWRRGLHAIAAMRRASKRMAAPAAVTLIGLGTLGLVSPFSGSPPRPPAARPAVVATPSHHPRPVAAAARPMQAPATASTVRHRPADVSTPRTARHTWHRLNPRVPCANVGGVVVGANCAHVAAPHAGPMVQLPRNPLGLKSVGVGSTDGSLCLPLPVNPLVKCKAAGTSEGENK